MYLNYKEEFVHLILYLNFGIHMHYHELMECLPNFLNYNQVDMKQYHFDNLEDMHYFLHFEMKLILGY